jgi:hypothetical protein
MATSVNVLNLKINTLTEAQYDAAVQQGVIGANELSMITDATSATVPSTMPVLLAANWSNSSQTVTVSGVTADNVVFVAPAPASASEWASSGILCTAQSADSLTFTCTQTPTNDLTANVVIF